MQSGSTQRTQPETRRNRPPLVALDRGYLTLAGHVIGGAKRFDGRKEPWLIARRDFEFACNAGFGKTWWQAEAPWSSLAAIVERLAQDDEAGAQDLIKRFEGGIPEYQSREAIARALKPFAKHADAHPALAAQQQKFNPNHDERGRFASGSGGCGSSSKHPGAKPQEATGRPTSNPKFKSDFLANYQEPIEAAERQLDICKDCLLGLSALESEWGRSDAVKNRNNLFGLDKGNGHIILTFPSVKHSILAWISHWGGRATGAKTPEEFVRQVNLNNRYNSEDPNWNQNVINVIRSVRRAIAIKEGN